MAYANTHDIRANGFSERFDALRKSLATRWANYMQYRKTVRELVQLSDRELSDLGLNRSMIRSIAMESVYDER